VNVDHSLLVKRDTTELTRLAKFIKRLQQGHATVQILHVVHEHDKACCKQEEMEKTMQAIREVIR